MAETDPDLDAAEFRPLKGVFPASGRRTMTDDDLRFAELDPDEQRQPEPPKEKLPHARYYLRAARWGFQAMVKNRQMGAGFMFHLVAVASVARAVPEVLITRLIDSTSRATRASAGGASLSDRFATHSLS